VGEGHSRSIQTLPETPLCREPKEADKKVVKRTRRLSSKKKEKKTGMGEDSPGSVLGPYKLSKLRIERLEAMGFIWFVMQQTVPATASKKVAGISTSADDNTLSFEDRIVEL
jgi:hypothetical protein